MLKYNSMALKEWAMVVWALGRGSQIMLLRKGGIAEREGEFRLAAKEFFLYPTYEHAQANLLQQRYLEVFRSLAVDSPADGDLQLDHYGAVTDVLPAPKLCNMKQLRDSFVWNDEFREKRYSYKPELPLLVLLVRTYTFPSPLRVARQEYYSGCHSWVELEEKLPTHNAIPLLGEEEFEERRKALLQRLAV
jgi:hypothetical protein